MSNSFDSATWMPSLQHQIEYPQIANEFVMLIAITAEILAGKNENTALVIVMLPSSRGSGSSVKVKLPFRNTAKLSSTSHPTRVATKSTLLLCQRK